MILKYNKLLASSINEIILLLIIVFLSNIGSLSAKNTTDFINFDQQEIISGKVIDQDGVPLAGVSIIKQGTSDGVSTDFDGNFSISASQDDILVFSYLGFLTQSIQVNSKLVLEVIMIEDAEQLDEIIVVGYGSVKKRDLTGAVGSIGGSDIESRGSTDPLEALQGQLPGVNISRSSGRSDVGFELVIRGQNSIAGGSPLYVVDGLVVDDINFLNPNDIVQMDILKDASSTAIYGSRGSNGVVLIQTNSAENSREDISITYDGYYGIKTPAHKAPMMNAAQWINYRIASRQGNSLEPFSGDIFSTTTQVVDASAAEWDREIRRRIAAGETYNWEDRFLKDGSRQNHFLTLNGISGNTSFSMSAGYLQEKGFIEKDFMDKYSFSLDLRHKFNDQFELGGQFRAGLKETEVAGGKSILNFYRMAPVVISSDPTGWLDEHEGITIFPGRMLTGSINPLLDQKYSNTNAKSLDVLGKIFFNYKPSNWLTLRTEFLPRISKLREGEWNGLYSAEAKGNQESTNASSRNRTRINYTWDNIVNAEKSFGKHGLQATGLFSIYHFEEEDYYSEVMNLTQETAFFNLGAANVNSVTDSQYTMNRLISYMMRLNYSFNDKYLLTVSNRWDGSSKLGDGYEWASFPSAAVAWKISEESFLKNVNFISNLKTRLSYGFTGNNNIDAYQSLVNANYLSNYDFGGSIANGISPSGISNRALTWERTEEVNFGVDFGFFNGRVSGAIDLYSRLSRDLLLNRKLPVPMGWDEMIDNIGSVRNEGIEATLRTINIKANDLTWETSFVFSKNKNSVVETNLGKVDDIVNGLFIGQPINVHYNYDMVGIWQLDEADEAALWGREPGMPKIRDISGPDGVPDGKIDAQYDRTIIGKPIPDWTGSFFTKLAYKNFDISMAIYTEQGIMKKSAFHNDLIYNNRNTVVHDYWTVTNPSNVAPSPAFLGDQYWGRKGAQLQNYRDTSYTRIQNITLGYVFPDDVTESLGIDRFRVYTNITNPYLYTDYDGHDPEFGDRGANDGPSFMTVQLGVNVKF